MESQKSQATIKVCMHRDCKERGSAAVLQNLRDGLSREEAVVLTVDECMSYCALGPNIAINDNLVTGVKPFLAVETVRAELQNPSCKADGVGSRPLEDLDTLIDDIEKL